LYCLHRFSTSMYSLSATRGSFRCAVEVDGEMDKGREALLR